MLVLQARALSHGRFDEAAASALADLAAQLGCERVSLGLLQGRRVRVAAISGVHDPRNGHEAALRIAAAMQEALDRRMAIVHPLPPESALHATAAHAALAHGNGRLAIYTVPVLCAGVAAGALLFERPQGFDAATLRAAEDAAMFVAPALVLQRRAERPLRAWWEAAWMNGPQARMASPAALIALVAVLLLIVAGAWPTTLRVVAPARVEGRSQQVLAAPVDGYVRAVSARPGDAIQAGQAIVQLEDQDLVLERERWTTEIAKLDKQYRDALSRDEAAAIVIAASKLQEARAQLALVQRQLERTVLKAPFDGVVISGDLSQSTGMPVKRGQELMTLATGREFRIVAEVDEQDVASLRPGQAARVLFASLQQPLPFTVERVSPVAVTLDGRNVFEVEGAGAPGAQTLRHGLRGVARIDVEPTFLAAVWWRQATQWLRQAAWRLLG